MAKVGKPIIKILVMQQKSIIKKKLFYNWYTKYENENQDVEVKNYLKN